MWTPLTFVVAVIPVHARTAGMVDAGIAVVVLLLFYRQTPHQGHRTGSNKSGVEEYIIEQL